MAVAVAVVMVSLTDCASRQAARTTSTTSNATLVPGTTSTSGPPSGHWPQQTITATGRVLSVAPTSQAVYWLAVTSPASAAPGTITPVRYDLASKQLTHGTSSAGVAGSSAVTATGGWVWVVTGEGAQAAVEQLDPTTLAIHSERDLPVTDTLYPSQSIPVLTATVGGPLWVAAGEDVWALNPSTGATEIEFDARNQINSMSTTPDGTLLYTSGVISDDGGFIVTEYDAHTGEQLHRSDQQVSVGAGTVAATNGGVWVSYRTGMAGPAQELSSETLSRIAPPNDLSGSFGSFDQIMGVGSGVSEGVLWLTSFNEITCADPSTSVVRASAAAAVSDPVAIGGLLYALPPSGGVAVITPPKTCFGM